MLLNNDAIDTIYLDSLLESLGDIIIFLSPEGIINKVSPLAENYFSWKLKDIKGKFFEDLYQMDHITTPFSQEEFYNLRDNRVILNCMLRVKNKKIHLSWSAVTINPSSGFILIGRDVSKIEELELKQRTQYREMEKMMAFVPGNFFWKNREGEYLGCSASHLKYLGFNSIIEIIGKTDKDLWPEQAEKIIKNDQMVIQTGEPLYLEEEIKIPREGSQVLTVVVVKMPLLDDEGNIIGILGNYLDITELKNTQKELEIAKEKAEAGSRVKTEFISNMGHDIRTPLAGIIGCAHYLEEHINEMEKREYAYQIHESGKQLLGLLNGVLDMISADSTHENDILQETFNLHHLIQDVLELECPAVSMNHLTIEIHIDEMIPYYVVGDKMKLHRILLNLTGNAIKFTKVGHIELNAKLLSREKDTATIEFQVKDSGIGIPDELQDKVFDQFFKVNPSYIGLQTGHGIGLHIAQKYVDLLGGHLSLQSKVGVGTSFYFTLKMKLGTKNNLTIEKNNEHPIANQLTQKTASQVPDFLQLKPAFNGNSLQVLLVEDNIPALTALKMMVTPYTDQISTAQDAESAFLLGQQHEFDLIISDISLPKQCGSELIKKIRAYEKKLHRRPCLIVGLTGHSVDKITQTCLDAGMNEVYRKPMTPAVLKDLIARYNLSDKTKEMPATTSNKSLGGDLPKTEAELFEIDHLPLLDIDLAIKLLGTEAMARKIFQSFNITGIIVDLKAMKEAHVVKNWNIVEKLAHKMSGGAVYGTVRLLYSLRYLERYCKAGHTVHLEDLYAQALRVIDETILYLDDWLGSRAK